MHINRRDILKVAIAGSLAAAAPSVVFSAEHKASKPLRILILGGTGFIGPHMVQTAVIEGTRSRCSTEVMCPSCFPVWSS